jgi:hypothetical protein
MVYDDTAGTNTALFPRKRQASGKLQEVHAEGIYQNLITFNRVESWRQVSLFFFAAFYLALRSIGNQAAWHYTANEYNLTNNVIDDGYPFVENSTGFRAVTTLDIFLLTYGNRAGVDSKFLDGIVYPVMILDGGFRRHQFMSDIGIYIIHILRCLMCITDNIYHRVGII